MGRVVWRGVVVVVGTTDPAAAVKEEDDDKTSLGVPYSSSSSSLHILCGAGRVGRRYPSGCARQR